MALKTLNPENQRRHRKPLRIHKKEGGCKFQIGKTNCFVKSKRNWKPSASGCRGAFPKGDASVVGIHYTFEQWRESRRVYLNPVRLLDELILSRKDFHHGKTT